jgi:hypothetical protein
VIERARAAASSGLGVSFATRALDAGEIVGSTSYVNVDAENRRLEIGFTRLVGFLSR